MSAATFTPGEPLPVALLVGASARCLLDEVLEQVLTVADSHVDLKQIPAKSFVRDKSGLLAQEVMQHLGGASLFSSQRIVVVLDGHALLREKAIQRWALTAPVRVHLILASVRSAKEGLPSVPAKIAEQTQTFFEPGPRGVGALRQWIQQRTKKRESDINAAASDRLIELTGQQLDAIDRELEKLCLSVPGAVIEERHVEELVGHSAGRDFDLLWQALKSGQRGRALALQQAMASEGLLMFGGGRIYGERPTAAAIVPLLLSRIRRVVLIAGSQGALRRELLPRVGVSPGFARFLERDARDLGRRLPRWIAAALAADPAQKRAGKVSEGQLLTTLILELTRP